MIERRQGMDLLNRAPLEYEDEVAILRDVAAHPQVDAARLGHIGVSHAGEMLFAWCRSTRACCAPASRSSRPATSLLHLDTSDLTPPDPVTGLRDIESLRLQDVEAVLARVDRPVAEARLSSVDLPVLVVGREGDEPAGRVPRDVRACSPSTAPTPSGAPGGTTCTATRCSSSLGPDGEPLLDDVQHEAVEAVVEFLQRTLA
nr:hypothetical protein [Angustibacter aerolatus]